MDLQEASMSEIQGVDGGSDFWRGFGAAVGGVAGLVASFPLGGLVAAATITAGTAAGATIGSAVDNW